jgi:hypothetical protein
MRRAGPKGGASEIRHRAGEFDDSDLDRSWVIAATDNSAANRECKGR